MSPRSTSPAIRRRPPAWPRVSRLLAIALAAGVACPTAIALNPAENPTHYIAAKWDTETGLPHNSVRQFFQTKDGYLWVGTTQGIARFDGLRFTVFNQHNTPGILNSQVTAFAETGDGSLWIATSYGLTRYFRGRFTSYLAGDGVKTSTGTVNGLCVAPDGSLWIGSRDGITRWVDGKFVPDIDTSAYDTLDMRLLTVDHSKAIWVACGTFGLRYRDGKFTQFGRPEGLPGQPVQKFVEDASGRVVAITQAGMYVLENERFVPHPANSALGNPRIGTALADRAGNFWIGSIGGLDRYTNGKLLPYVGRHGETVGVVDALFEDRENCLWVGTSGGLYRLTDRRGYSLSTEDHITGTLTLSVAQTRDGALWVASWGGGVERLRDGAATHFGVGAPLSYETITCIYETPDGAMWLGTRSSAIDRLEAGKVKTYVYPPGVATRRPVTAMLADRERGFLIGISKRGLLQLKDEQIVPVPEAAELAPHTVWTINRLSDGRLVIGTSKGIYQCGPDGTWRPVGITGVPSPVVARALHERADGTIWLATEGRGLVRWRRDGGRAYGSRDGMVDDTLFGVCDDGIGGLWVNSSRGIARIRESEFGEVDRGESVSLNPMTFGRIDGLLSAANSGNGTPSLARLADGRLVFATDTGIAVIDPRRLRTNPQPPNVVIEQAVADEEPLPIGDGIIVPAGTNRLEIDYTALSLVAPHRLRFRYQLEGSDPQWIEAGHQRAATYTHLAPGRYRFRVLACNNDGIWNDTGASLAVVMQPRFHQTLLFRSTAALAAVAAIASAVGWRMQQCRRGQRALANANAELDLRVRERTAELSRSNAELQQRESLFRLIFEHAPVGISWHRTDLGPDYHFNSAFRRILGIPADAPADGSLVASLVHPEDAPRQAELDARVRSGATNSYAIEQRFVREDATVVHAILATAVVRDEQGEIVQVIGILEDITARKLAEEELAQTYKRLMEVSRLTGMAEVATGVLHNVGNVLNSVNVSVSVLGDSLRQTHVEGLIKLSGLLQEHSADLAQFLASDSRGQRVVPYLAKLADHLRSSHERMHTEIESLRANTDHIKEIVARQQSLARQGGLLERLTPTELMEGALQMVASGLQRHGVDIVRDFQPAPVIVAERHKILQILINLLQNAKEALKAGRAADRRLVTRINVQDGFVRFEVTDNGIGIPPGNLTRVFEHGFTTRASGHGFGLHSGAIAAQQMSGRLTAASEGPGAGATFILELPVAQSAAVVVDFSAGSRQPPPQR